MPRRKQTASILPGAARGGQARPRRALHPAAGIGLVALCMLAAPRAGLCADAKGKISKNFYRIPYEDGSQVKITNDYITHGNSPAGNTGPLDMRAEASNRRLVAAAAGRIQFIRDSLTECGCDPAYGGCANVIRIDHANGERSIYLHVQANSVTDSAGLSVGDCVFQGQFIGIEGDVGFTCGGGRAPNAGSCVPTVPAGATNCGRHLHWEVRRLASDEFMNPMICNVPGNLLLDDVTYEAGDCNGLFCIGFLQPAGVFSGFGNFTVMQAADSIRTSGLVVQDTAAVVLHAGKKVQLRPGFHAKAGGYFRAEIGPCGRTANAGCP